MVIIEYSYSSDSDISSEEIESILIIGIILSTYIYDM